MTEPARPVSITEAREIGGLRPVVLGGVPSPWTQAAKAILHVKGLPHTLVQRTEDDPPDALESWTGQASFPAAMYEDEPPRCDWAEILLLAERLAPKPALIPDDPEQRALLFGLSHEIAGEMGLGWCRRLELIDAGRASDPPNPMSAYLGAKYGGYPESIAQATGRVHEVLRMLDERLRTQRAAGNDYLMGPELCALDIYWATFCNLLAPLPPERMNLADAMRPMFTSSDPVVAAILAEGLLEHRDFIYQEHLVLPVVL